MIDDVDVVGLVFLNLVFFDVLSIVLIIKYW